MQKFLVAALFGFIVFAKSTSPSAADALLECQIENETQVVKIEKSIFGHDNVYFNTNGTWIERDVYDQNEEYIWVRSKFGFGDDEDVDEPLSCGSWQCEFDFQIELIERTRGKRTFTTIQRIADGECMAKIETWGKKSCKAFEAGDRINSIECKILQRFKAWSDRMLDLPPVSMTTKVDD